MSSEITTAFEFVNGPLDGVIQETSGQEHYVASNIVLADWSHRYAGPGRNNKRQNESRINTTIPLMSRHNYVRVDDKYYHAGAIPN